MNDPIVDVQGKIPGAQPSQSAPPCPKCGATDTTRADTNDMCKCNKCGAEYAMPAQQIMSVVRDDTIPTRFYMSVPNARTIDAVPSDIAGLPKSILGEPCFYVWKDISTNGEWSNPARGFDFPVTHARMDHWIQMFDARMSNGEKVPLPDDHKEEAAKNNGWLVKVKKDGEKFMGLLQLVGEDAKKKAAKNDVSVCTDDMVNARKEVFPDAIRHVAFTCLPMNPGLSAPVFANSQPNNNTVLTQQPRHAGTKDVSMLQMSDAQRQALISLVPGLADVPETIFTDKLIDCVKMMSGSMKEMSAVAPMISRLDPEMDAQWRAIIDEKVQRCIEKRALGEACANRLVMSMIGTAEAPQWLGMSRIVNDDGRKVPALFRVLDILADNRPVPLAGRNTGAQRYNGERTMSRDNPDGEKEIERDPAKAAAKFKEATKFMSASPIL